eukprot:TRINITY_DN2684_c0_g2_i1.p1 TRINITY_DN2684_c0_g2~~TRINITY_DN2684_c0_g2_i1.p1  ORF type:complete len:949 (-),score=150.94 TRINITY_DN2684_c0_g2_i1:125-2971(-)
MMMQESPVRIEDLVLVRAGHEEGESMNPRSKIAGVNITQDDTVVVVLNTLHLDAIDIDKERFKVIDIPLEEYPMLKNKYISCEDHHLLSKYYGNSCEELIRRISLFKGQTSTQDYQNYSIIQCSMAGKTRLIIELNKTWLTVLIKCGSEPYEVLVDFLELNKPRYTRDMDPNEIVTIAEEYNNFVMSSIRLFFLSYFLDLRHLLEQFSLFKWGDLDDSEFIDFYRVYILHLCNQNRSTARILKNLLQNISLKNSDIKEFANEQERALKECLKLYGISYMPLLALDECHEPLERLNGFVLHEDYQEKKRKSYDEFLSTVMYEIGFSDEPVNYLYDEETCLLSSIRTVMDDYTVKYESVCFFLTTEVSAYSRSLISPGKTRVSRNRVILHNFSDLHFLDLNEVKEILRNNQLTNWDAYSWIGRPGVLSRAILYAKEAAISEEVAKDYIFMEYFDIWRKNLECNAEIRTMMIEYLIEAIFKKSTRTEIRDLLSSNFLTVLEVTRTQSIAILCEPMVREYFLTHSLSNLINALNRRYNLRDRTKADNSEYRICILMRSFRGRPLKEFVDAYLWENFPIPLDLEEMLNRCIIQVHDIVATKDNAPEETDFYLECENILILPDQQFGPDAFGKNDFIDASSIHLSSQSKSGRSTLRSACESTIRPYKFFNKNPPRVKRLSDDIVIRIIAVASLSNDHLNQIFQYNQRNKPAYDYVIPLDMTKTFDQVEAIEHSVLPMTEPFIVDDSITSYDDIEPLPSPFYSLCEFGNVFELKTWLDYVGVNMDQEEADGSIPLHGACKEGNFKVLEYLVGKGCDINTQAKNGITPLHVASMYKKKKVVDLLVQNGADLDLTEMRGKTALMIACEVGDIKIVKQLISAGSNVNILDSAGTSPLHFASENGKLNLVKCLVSAGALLNQIDGNGRTPLMATTSVEVYEYLQSKGAKKAAQNKHVNR